jgi:hypothetical protein
MIRDISRASGVPETPSSLRLRQEITAGMEDSISKASCGYVLPVPPFRMPSRFWCPAGRASDRGFTQDSASCNSVQGGNIPSFQAQARAIAVTVRCRRKKRFEETRRVRALTM